MRLHGESATLCHGREFPCERQPCGCDSRHRYPVGAFGSDWPTTSIWGTQSFAKFQLPVMPEHLCAGELGVGVEGGGEV